MKRRQGFTLIEIMVVVIIIGVLAGIALPLYSKAVEKARITEAISVLGTIRDAELRYALEYGGYSSQASGTCNPLDINVSQTTKYFSYSCNSVGANPYDSGDQRLANATRSSTDAGVFTNPLNYVIYINESGNLGSTSTEVNSILQNM